MWKMKYLNKNYWHFYICGSVFTLMLILNVLTPMVLDDYDYSFSLATGLRIESFLDIIDSMIYHYYNWGGRIFAHVLASSFLLFPMIIFDIANSLIFVLFGILIYRFVIIDEQGNSWNNEVLILIYLLLFLSIPTFGQTVLWLTGACNYLWTMVAMLAFLLPFRIYCTTGKSIAKMQTIPYCILAFCAGGGNEHTSAATLLCAGLISLYIFYKKRAIKRWMVSGIVSGFVGWLILILAPGNYARLESVDFEQSRLGRYLAIFKTATQYLEGSSLWLLVLVLFGIIVAYYYKIDKEIIYLVISVLLCAILGNYAMMAASYYPVRAYMGTQVYLIIALIMLYYHLKIQGLELLKKGFLAFIMVKVIFQFIYAMGSIAPSYYYYLQRELMIEESIERGVYEIETIGIRGYSPYNAFYIGDLEANPAEWGNEMFAKYHEILSIKADKIIWN